MQALSRLGEPDMWQMRVSIHRQWRFRLFRILRGDDILVKWTRFQSAQIVRKNSLFIMLKIRWSACDLAMIMPWWVNGHLSWILHLFFRLVFFSSMSNFQLFIDLKITTWLVLFSRQLYPLCLLFSSIVSLLTSSQASFPQHPSL